MRYIYLIFFSSFCCGVSNAQTDYSAVLSGRSLLSDVSKIRTKNDFDQKLLTINQIDERISDVVKSQPDDNYLIETPINSKLLVYVGKKHLKDVLSFSPDAFASRLNFVSNELEIYSYDGIYILLPSRDGKDLLNLFFMCRALTILKVKYPEAYNVLLKSQQLNDAEAYLTKNLFHKIVSFNVSNFILSFDKSPNYIAASTADIAYANTNDLVIAGNRFYKNTINLVTSLDVETIYGVTEFGSRKVYNYSDPNENYFHYMRDGLIESLIHELLHQYITNNANVDPKAYFINEMRFDTVDRQFQADVEEAIVLNTALRYYEKRKGVSKTVIDFYSTFLKVKEKIITDYFGNKINLQRYYALKALSETNATEFKDIYFLNVLEK